MSMAGIFNCATLELLQSGPIRAGPPNRNTQQGLSLHILHQAENITIPSRFLIAQTNQHGGKKATAVKLVFQTSFRLDHDRSRAKPLQSPSSFEIPYFPWLKLINTKETVLPPTESS
jgi:hypothetical protein